MVSPVACLCYAIAGCARRLAQIKALAPDCIKLVTSWRF
jgi:hypothetical protein